MSKEFEAGMFYGLTMKAVNPFRVIYNSKKSYLRVKFELNFPEAERAVAEWAQRYIQAGNLFERTGRVWRGKSVAGGCNLVISSKVGFALLVKFFDKYPPVGTKAEAYREWRKLVGIE